MSYRARVAKTYRATFSTFAWSAWALFLIIFGSLLLASPRWLGAQAFLVALIVSAFEAFFLQFARCGVTAQAAGLIVRQPVSRLEVPWSQVDDVSVDRAGALEISLVTGTDVWVFGFGGSLIGLFTGGIHAKRARDGILASRPTTSADALPTAVTPRVTLYWRWILGTLFALELAALVGILAH